MTAAEKEERIAQAVRLCELEPLLTMHPYDLSGGEQQRAALAKVLLLRPRILLLDEPTKGLDGQFKEKLAGILKNLQAAGTTIVLVSHDIEFCAKYADRCAMFFNGGITSCDTPRRFFGGKSFYTTAANRMARTTMPDAVLAEDMILALGGRVLEQKKQKPESGCTVQNNRGLKEKRKKQKANAEANGAGRWNDWVVCHNGAVVSRKVCRLAAISGAVCPCAGSRVCSFGIFSRTRAGGGRPVSSAAKRKEKVIQTHMGGACNGFACRSADYFYRLFLSG